ncbi:MAG TPA: hypothetical protein PLY26_09190, partial [Ferruginibacter sp.]|nr:hypothetical protein [Ferruginibacter sp.]
MNRKLLLSSSFIIAGLVSAAQDANRTYAITGDGNGDFLWMNIRQVDIGSGKVTQDIYQRNKTAFVLADADSKTPLANYAQPTATMVAAAAYDKNHDKLFFTPMRIGELRWLDLNAKGDQKKFYSLRSPLFAASETTRDEAKNFTRMVIGADGN